MSQQQNRIEALSVPGGRGRVACARVAEFTGDLATALRRAVPFLARKRVGITAEEPRCVSFAQLAADATIVHAVAFTVGGSSGSRGLVLVDEVALARMLDGVLGGGGETSSLGSAALTSAQFALASRVSGGVLRAFSDVIASKLGVEIKATASKDIEPGSAVVAALALDAGGRILVAIPLSAIRTSEAAEADAAGPAPIDAGIAMAMTEVEVDIVAELGKVRLPLETIANLKVGDVLRLTLPLDERARVCAGGAMLFQGRPTASGEVVAVALERSVVG
jgi:flagellar motor switch protein FliM